MTKDKVSAVAALVRKRPLTPIVTGGFFAVATAIVTLTAISLLFPGTGLDAMWRLKPQEHLQLLQAGLLVPIAFLGLAALMGLASAGCFMRRRWAWKLALVIFLANGLGDAVRIALGSPVEGVLGVSIVALILAWLTRARIRRLFDR